MDSVNYLCQYNPAGLPAIDSLKSMIHKILSHPLVQLAISLMAGFGVVICIFPSVFPAFSWLINYAVQLMLFYLAMGLFSLFLSQHKLTFVFFGGCAVLCLFLKYSIKNNDIERWRETVIHKKLHENVVEKPTPALKIAHVNVTYADSIPDITKVVRIIEPDVLSFHEVTPDWDVWLADSLSAAYPYNRSMVDIGIFGMAIYSKVPLLSLDTFWYQDRPNLRGGIVGIGDSINLFSVHTEPALNVSSLERLRSHLSVVGEEIREFSQPALVFGEFNAVPWSGEIQTFLSKTNLSDSRTGFMSQPTGVGGSFFDLPLDHIFYSSHMQCVGFQTLMGGSPVRRLGISGAFTMKKNGNHVVKETAQ
jgi:endonuclease/exonuclease/phosphatase family metal-dependent hydrolase